MQINCIATGSKGNCYLIKTKNNTFLLDIGIPFKQLQKGVNFKINEIDFALATHCHADHFNQQTVKELLTRNKPIYAPKQAIDKLGEQKYYSLHEMQAYTIIKPLDSIVVMPFPLQHINADGSDCENLGFLIYDTIDKERLLYITDTQYVKDKITDKLDYIIIECNFSEDVRESEVNTAVNFRRLNSHMSLNTLLGFLDTLDLSVTKCIYLCHISNSDMADVDKIKLEVQKHTGVLVEVFE